MTMRIPLPESLRPPEGEVAAPATPRDAATIALVRDGANGLETYLLRRRSTLEFAPGVLVFPGGGVHDGDLRVTEWIGPDVSVWAKTFNCEESLARGLVVAALRETFEESGVLFASPGDDESVIADTSGFAAERLALDAGELDFADFLDAQGLVLRVDLIGAWAHWVTPTFEPRRFDTRFFVAAVPEGQQVGELPGEADRASWWPIREIWPAIESGTSMMLPPTSVTCRELAGLTVADLPRALAERAFARIEPALVDIDGQLFLEYAGVTEP
jgi:8-oxo-dGTP pyrophosphatase MutT (NUDIX family)